MSGHVFVVSEWLPKKNKDDELWKSAKKIMAQTAKEKGCLGAHATRQIAQLGSPEKSKYTIMMLQKYVDSQAFDIHCKADYVISFFEKYVENEDTAIVKEWICRVFREED